MNFTHGIANFFLHFLTFFGIFFFVFGSGEVAMVLGYGVNAPWTLHSRGT